MYFEIPEIDYNAVEQDDIAFEYYSNGLDEESEIWILVEKSVENEVRKNA